MNRKMNSKPLTYDSLKTVLQYMDPNTRLLLSSRAPSIRTAEKAVPLKIDDLQIRNHSIKVNGTEYRYEIYQVDCKDKIPYRVSGECELNGNWVCDVNEFGVRDYIAKYNCVVPGNNRFQNQNLFGDYDDEEIVTHYGRLKKLRSILAMEKQQYEQLKSHQPENDPISREEKQGCFEMFKSIRRNIARVYTNEELEIRHDDEYTGSDLEPLKSEKVVKEAIETAGKRIRQMENELLPFENKINNIRPKFEIHLTKNKEIRYL
uniref:Transposase n=2 Tax=Caenorhabditis tropicalis TaxID=1561998 RepID=A0A1I7T3S6_9PELO